jgi:hypothetical protein
MLGWIGRRTRRRPERVNVVAAGLPEAPAHRAGNANEIHVAAGHEVDFDRC